MEKPSPLLFVLILSSLVGDSREEKKVELNCEYKFIGLIRYVCTGGKNHPITKETVTSAVRDALKPNHRMDEVDEL